MKTIPTKQKLVTMYIKKRYSLMVIGSLLGISSGNLNRLFKKYKIPKRKRGHVTPYF